MDDTVNRSLIPDTICGMADLEIRTSEIDDGWTSISVEGEIDIATAEQLQESIDEVLGESNRHLVVDLRATAFMDSTGLRTLVMADRRFKDAQRSFAIVVQGGPVSRLIELSGLRSALTVLDSLEDLAG